MTKPALVAMSRRSLLRGLFAAPAIVAIGNIMPVKVISPPPLVLSDGSPFIRAITYYDHRLSVQELMTITRGTPAYGFNADGFFGPLSG